MHYKKFLVLFFFITSLTYNSISQKRYSVDQTNIGKDSIVTLNFTNEFITGIVYYYFYDSTLREVYVKDGFIEKYEYFDRFGLKYKVREYSKNVLNGFNYNKLVDDEQNYETFFIKGKRNGIHKYYSNDRIKSIFNFENDNFVGTQKFWSDSLNSFVEFDLNKNNFSEQFNTLENERLFHSSEIMYGFQTEGWVSDIIIRSTYFPEDGDGELVNGYIFDYYPNAQLKFLDHVIDGKRVGIQKGWYQNGKMMYEAEIILRENDSTKETEIIEKGWFENGHQKYFSINKESIDFKKGGMNHEEFTNSWYENGEKQLEAKIYNGENLEKCYGLNGQEISCEELNLEGLIFNFEHERYESDK